MYSIGIFITLCIFAGGANSQNHEPTFIAAPPEYVVEGDRITMNCEVNTGTTFMLNYVLRFTHRSAKTGADTVISNQGTLEDGMEEKGYSLKYNIEDRFSVEISLDQATPEVDGEYLCQVKAQSGETILEEVSASVQFLAGVERVELVVGNTTVTSPDQKVEFRMGEVYVGCTSYGSNPAPMIHLSIGDTDISADVNSIQDENSDLPRRSFVGEANTMLDFTHDMIGKQLSCHAETGLPDGVNVQLPDASSSAILNAIVDEPTIECTNNTAGDNDKQITLKCKVSKVPKLKKVFFSVGNRYIIYPGNKTKDLTICTVNEFDLDFNEYVLQFYKLEKWHFSADIYLEAVGYDDTVYKYQAYLIRDEVGGSAAMTSSLLALATSVILASFVMNSS